ncbi:MAG: hypothetical protein KAS38_14070 [Anaerolineales bacterium]|nr:hypothetical protein [Anaerolineales bacterium]
MKAYKVVRADKGKLYSLTTDRKYATMKRYQNKVAPFFAFRTLEDAKYSGMVFHGVEVYECEVSEMRPLLRSFVMKEPHTFSRRDLTNWWRRGCPWMSHPEMMYAPTETVLVPDFTLEKRVWPM